MLQQSVLKRRGTGHQLPRVLFDLLTRSDEQSRKLDESGVSLGKCCSISASTETVEHTCPASSSDPVQQDPCVTPLPSPQYGVDLGRGHDRYPARMNLWAQYHRYNMGTTHHRSAEMLRSPASLDFRQQLCAISREWDALQRCVHEAKFDRGAGVKQ